MQLFIDKDTGLFVSDSLFKAPVETVVFKRGDAAEIELKFVQGNIVTGLASGATVALGIKNSGDFDGDFLAYAATDEFTSVSNSYFLSPSFNTEALNEALGMDGTEGNDIASLNAMCEATWSEASGVWQSSRTITATIHNDVVKGDEGAPTSLPSPDDWLGERAVLFSEAQALTSGQQEQARGNVGIVLAPGGAGAADSGKVPTFGANGILGCSRFLSCSDTIVSGARIFLSAYVGGQSVVVGNNGYNAFLDFPSSLAAHLHYTLPNFGGSVAVAPTYADDAAAASGGLASGDLYFTGTKFRVRTV